MNLLKKWLAPPSEPEYDEEVDSLIRWDLREMVRGEEPPPDGWQRLRARLSPGAASQQRPRPGLWRAFLQRTQPLAATALLVMLIGAALARGQIGLPYGAEPTRVRPTATPPTQTVEVEVPLRYTVLDRGQPLPDDGVVNASLLEKKETRPAIHKILALSKPREIRPS
ncbi:MAG: hypothetical protein IT330_09725 [Anaerolineae bacterium]|nr:hypothetical protein [Anaerolineae bacterium]